MHRRILFVSALVGFAWSTATTVWCERLVAQELSSNAAERLYLTQRSEGDASTWDRGFRGWWNRRTSDYLKTHSSVKAAYRAPPVRWPRPRPKCWGMEK